MKHANPRPQHSALRFQLVRAASAFVTSVILALVLTGYLHYLAQRPTVLVGR